MQRHSARPLPSATHVYLVGLLPSHMMSRPLQCRSLAHPLPLLADLGLSLSVGWTVCVHLHFAVKLHFTLLLSIIRKYVKFEIVIPVDPHQ